MSEASRAHVSATCDLRPADMYPTALYVAIAWWWCVRSGACTGAASFLHRSGARSLRAAAAQHRVLSVVFTLGSCLERVERYF